MSNVAADTHPICFVGGSVRIEIGALTRTKDGKIHYGPSPRGHWWTQPNATSLPPSDQETIARAIRTLRCRRFAAFELPPGLGRQIVMEAKP